MSSTSAQFEIVIKTEQMEDSKPVSSEVLSSKSISRQDIQDYSDMTKEFFPSQTTSSSSSNNKTPSTEKTPTSSSTETEAVTKVESKKTDEAASASQVD